MHTTRKHSIQDSRDFLNTPNASFTLMLAIMLHAFSLLANVDDDETLCRAYAASHANETWRQPSGALQYPYLVPAGPYEQEWDWDSVFLGSWGACAGCAADIDGDGQVNGNDLATILGAWGGCP